MAERTRPSEQDMPPFLKRLFFVMAGVVAAGLVAKEFLPVLFHVMRPEMHEILDSQASGEVIRRSVHMS